MRKNKYKILTRQDWEQSKPKSFTPITYSRTIRKIIDHNTWGWIDPEYGYTEKEHLFGSDTINEALRGTETLLNKRTGDSRTISTASNIQSKQWHQVAHIEHSEKVMFYVCSLFSNICMPGLDIDPTDTSTQDDMNKVSDFIKEFMPCYIEKSTKQKGRHGYPIIEFTPYVEAYGRYKFPFYANRLLSLDPCSLASLLKLYINSRFNVKFDNIKGYYSQYQWQKFNGRNYLHRTNASVLIKQPKTTNESDFFSLVNSPVLSISDIQDKMSWLLNELKGDVPDIENTKLGTYNKASSDFLPCQEENTDELEPQTTENSFSSLSSLSYVYIPAHFENVADIALESDVILRSRRYLYYCFTQYMINEGREPTIEEYRQDYRQDVGTGLEDQGDIIRLEYIYNTNKSKMRKYFYGSLKQKINMMEQKLGIEQEDIDRRSTYYRKLWKKEVAITAVWIELCLTNQDYIGKKKWWSMSKGEHYTRELTVPMTSLEKFIECLKKKELNKNGCNPRKARALRELLIDLGWMQCVDDTVIIASHNNDKGGRARRYILLPDHPGYQRFEKIAGKDRIEHWKEFRQEQLRLRSGKNRRRVG